MKKIVKVLLGILLFFSFIVLAVFYFTRGMTGNVEAFFQAASENNTDEAYEFLSKDFQSGISKNEFVAFLITNSLNQYKSATWTSRSISGTIGSLVGTIKTKSGASIPLNLDMVKEENSWKIYSINKKSSGVPSPKLNEISNRSSSTMAKSSQVISSVDKAGLPSKREQIEMINESMYIFAQSVKDKSMSSFHKHVSILWKKQHDVAKLDSTFSGFYKLGGDLRIIKNYTPVITNAPEIDDKGVLLIQGYYPTTPSRLTFSQKYIYEQSSWKLMGFTASLKPEK